MPLLQKKRLLHRNRTQLVLVGYQFNQQMTQLETIVENSSDSHLE